jgi:cAMP-dependent protein kinase regulator
VPVTRGTLDLPDAVPTLTSEAEFEEEFIVALQDVIDAGELRGALPASEEQELYAAFYGTPRAPVTSPLFGDFTEEELCAVIGCLELLTFQPGDIVITEGEPGDSLFVLTTGILKTFVHDPTGHNVLVRVLEEGTFFGEISVLTGKPRTATVVAASRCELLELDRSALDSVTANHPRVRDVIEEARRARSGSEEEVQVRGR